MVSKKDLALQFIHLKVVVVSHANVVDRSVADVFVGMEVRHERSVEDACPGNHINQPELATSESDPRPSLDVEKPDNGDADAVAGEVDPSEHLDAAHHVAVDVAVDEVADHLAAGQAEEQRGAVVHEDEVSAEVVDDLLDEDQDVDGLLLDVGLEDVRVDQPLGHPPDEQG